MLRRCYLGILCLLCLSGCGSTYNTAWEEGAQTGTPPPAEAGEFVELEVVHEDLPAQAVSQRVAPEAGVFRFYAIDAQGGIIYGPVEFPRAAVTRLPRVPTAVRGLRVEYVRPDGKVLQYAEVTVSLVKDGETTRVVINGPTIKNRFFVQLVNESDLPDDQVYVLASSNNGDLGPQGVQGVPVLDIKRTTAANGTKVESVPLSTVPKATRNGQVLTTTTLTGKVREVREFSCDHLQSAVFFVSYGSPLAYTAVGPLAWAAPSEDVGIRFEKFEASCDKFQQTYFTNLSTIDLYGIPMQAERIDSGTGAVTDVRTFYTSTRTFMKEAFRLAGGSNEIFLSSDVKTPYVFNPDGKEPQPSFVRVLSPKTFTQQVASRGANKGLPTPYPSLESYLRSLVGKSVRVQGLEHGVEYDYSGTFSFDDPRKTFDVKLTGTMAIKQQGTYDKEVFVPLSRSFTLHLPLANHPLTLPKEGEEITSLDNYILAAPLGHFVFDLDLSNLDDAQTARLTEGIAKYKPGGQYAPDMTTHDVVSASPSPGASPAGSPVFAFTLGSEGLLEAVNQSPYINVYGDVVVGLMRGYVGSTYTGTSSADWFQKEGHLRSYPPFGAARGATDDGHYYGWCALAYNTSDSYGHPYDDREGRPPVPLNFPPPDTLRISVLADDRLDAPVATANVTGDNLNVSWPAVEGASGYTLAISPLDSPFNTTVNGTSFTRSLAELKLNAGTPYSVAVRAQGQKGTSQAMPVSILTPGTTPETSGSLQWEQQILLIPGFTISLNGQPLTGATIGSKVLNGQLGWNRCVVKVQDAQGQTVLSATILLDFQAASEPTAAGFSFVNKPANLTWFDLVRSAVTGVREAPSVQLPRVDGKPVPVPPPFSAPPAVVKVGSSEFVTGLTLFSNLKPAPERVVKPVVLPRPSP